MTLPFASRGQRDRIYGVLYEAIDRGPFDGGCLALACALQAVHGGQLHVVLGRPSAHAHLASVAQHAVLALPDGRWLDAGGLAASGQHIARRFARIECGHTVIADGVRPWAPGDLPDSPADAALVARLVGVLRDEPTTLAPRRAKLAPGQASHRYTGFVFPALRTPAP